jgi:hypothetical protein
MVNYASVNNIGDGNAKAVFDSELNAVKDLADSLDILYSNAETGSNPVSKLVNEQNAKLLVERDDIDREIKSLTAEITAKETEFVDLKKIPSNSSNFNNLFTQQDYLTMMLYAVYIIMSMAFYWRMITTDGFSYKGLISFIVGWLIATVMLFNLFSRFV